MGILCNRAAKGAAPLAPSELAALRPTSGQWAVERYRRADRHVDREHADRPAVGVERVRLALQLLRGHVPRLAADAASEKGVRLAQKMQVGPCVPVGIQLEKAGVGPASGPTRRLSRFGGFLSSAGTSRLAYLLRLT